MKTLNENSTKVTKDVLLHQIFQEISEENKEMNAESYLLDDIIPVPKTGLSKIREIQKKRQWFFIVLLVVSIIYVLFSTDSGSTQVEVQKSHDDIYVIPKANQIDNQKEVAKSHDVKIKTNPIQIIEKNAIKDKEVKIQTVIRSKKPQTTREKAKEALFMQMQN